MLELTMFYLVDCPYCHHARWLIEKVREETPEYKNVRINYVDEDKEKEISDSHNYYYVPAFYAQGKKLHEGPVNLEKIREIFKAVYYETK
jgi:glutaredoxin